MKKLNYIVFLVLFWQSVSGITLTIVISILHALAGFPIPDAIGVVNVAALSLMWSLVRAVKSAASTAFLLLPFTSVALLGCSAMHIISARWLSIWFGNVWFYDSGRLALTIIWPLECVAALLLYAKLFGSPEQQ